MASSTVQTQRRAEPRSDLRCYSLFLYTVTMLQYSVCDLFNPVVSMDIDSLSNDALNEVIKYADSPTRQNLRLAYPRVSRSDVFYSPEREFAAKVTDFVKKARNTMLTFEDILNAIAHARADFKGMPIGLDVLHECARVVREEMAERAASSEQTNKFGNPVPNRATIQAVLLIWHALLSAEPHRDRSRFAAHQGTNDQRPIVYPNGDRVEVWRNPSIQFGIESALDRNKIQIMIGYFGERRNEDGTYIPTETYLTRAMVVNPPAGLIDGASFKTIVERLLEAVPTLTFDGDFGDRASMEHHFSFWAVSAMTSSSLFSTERSNTLSLHGTFADLAVL